MSDAIAERNDEAEVRSVSRRAASRITAWVLPLAFLDWLVRFMAWSVAVLVQGARRRTWRDPVRAEFLRTMDLAGVRSLPAVLVLGILVGLSVISQGLLWLGQVGQESLVRDAIALILAREIAPLLIGLLAIGRNGLVILGEVGTLKINGTCRALDSQGVDPFLLLVVPRVFAMAICVFFLTVILILETTLIGFTAASLLGLAEFSPVGFIIDTVGAIGVLGYLIVLLKGLAIGFVAGLVCCMTAMEVPVGTRDLTGLMPRGFVHSVLAVLLVSGLISVMF